MRLDELKALEAAASPAPWTIDHLGHGERCECAHLALPGAHGRHQVLVDHRRDFSDPAPDAAFIAAARTMLPRLIAVAEAATRVGRCIGDGISVLKGSAYHALLAEALAALEAP